MGKHKEQNLIKIVNQPKFGIWRLYNIWKDPETGKDIKAVTIVTAEANELMAEIHNAKHRISILLTKQNNIDGWMICH